jgi:tartrate-resistant acid phosphatase type 5
MATKWIVKIFITVLLFLSSSLLSQPTVRFAVIGDYGKWSTGGEALVSTMIHGWNPDLILTTGDNNYEVGADSTIDSNIGQYYHDYIYPYNGIFGSGSAVNKFFPSLGNHDLITPGAQPYLDYFTLPGNERYYSFVKGNCEFFAINSDMSEPDGHDSTSLQAQWLQLGLRSSTARIRVVYFHHPPYSSGQHGSTEYMKWPFKGWGATVVLAGHEHDYERLVSDNFTYFISGLGGKDWREFAAIVPESRFRFTGNFGAMLVTAYNDSINFKFYAVPDSLKDDTTIILTTIGIQPVGTEIPVKHYLYNNYPNPFNPVTKIKFDISAGNMQNSVMVKIYDALGGEVSTLVNEPLRAGTYEIEWDASNYPSGIYFCRLYSENLIFTSKMILTK